MARLMAEHGDAKLTDLLPTPVDCPKARSVSIHDRCKARYGAASFHVDPTGRSSASLLTR